MNDQKGRARSPRKKSSSLLGTVVVVVLLAVLVGLGITYREPLVAFVKAQLNPPDAAPTPPVAKAEAPEAIKPIPAAPPERKAIPPVPKQQGSEKAASALPAAKTALPTGEETKAQKLIEDGHAALARLEFGAAAGLFKQASGLKAGALIEQAERLAKKATAFETATRHIPVADFASAELAYELTTHSGQVFTGLKIREEAETVLFQSVSPSNPASQGKTTLPVAKADIRSMTAVTKSQRQEAFRKLVADSTKELVPARSADFYDAVYLSKRLGLSAECMAFLNKAYEGGSGHAPDPYLGESFRKEVVRRAIDNCAMMLAAGRGRHLVQARLNDLLKTLPNYQLAQEEVEAFKATVMSKVRDDFRSTLTAVKKPAPEPTQVAAVKPVAVSAKELVREDEITEVMIDDSGVKGNGAAAPIVDRANSAYEEGMKLYRGYKLGTNGNNNQVLEAAMKKLQEAVDLYDKALSVDGSNRAILDRQTEANMIVYACKKYKTL